MYRKLKRAVNQLLNGICYKHSGKMSGMQSFSTSCTCNKYCAIRAKNSDSVCSHCYAMRQLAYQTNTEKKCLRNDWIKYGFLSDSEIPVINAALFRFEAFGDIETPVQFINYMRIAQFNPQTTFTLFTKNLFVAGEAFLMEDCPDKPDNFIIVASSERLNQPRELPEYAKEFVDKIFTVYEKAYAERHNIPIQCGKNQCIHCRRCYRKTGNLEYINELLK